MLSPSTEQRDRSTKRELFGANGSIIHTFGEQLIKLDVGLRRDFRWPFVIADVQQPILGTDFVEHFGLLVDFKHQCLRDTETNLSVLEKISAATNQCVHSVLPLQLHLFRDIEQRQPYFTPVHDTVH